jgi:hypothetical protein
MTDASNNDAKQRPTEPRGTAGVPPGRRTLLSLCADEEEHRGHLDPVERTRMIAELEATLRKA